MADILEFMKNREQWIGERYELVRERMDGVASEDMTGLFREEYLTGMALFLRDALRVYDLKSAGMLDGMTLEDQKGIHDQLYHASVWDLWGEPAPLCQEGDVDWETLLWAAGREWRLAAGYAMSGQRFLLTAVTELFLQVYQLFEMERNGEVDREELKKSVRLALYYHFSDYCDVTAAMEYHNLLFPGEFTEQIMNAAAEDCYGLYRLGGMVDETALLCARTLSELSAENLAHLTQSLAEQLYEKISADSQSHGEDYRLRAAIIVPAGTERAAQALGRQFRFQGMEPVCLRRMETFTSRAADGRPAPECSLFWDKALRERRLCEEKNAREVYRPILKTLVGVIDLETLK